LFLQLDASLHIVDRATAVVAQAKSLDASLVRM
jgi:hypothetical protein